MSLSLTKIHQHTTKALNLLIDPLKFDEVSRIIFISHLRDGINVNAENGRALYFFCRIGDVEIVQLLVGLGAQVEITEQHHGSLFATALFTHDYVLMNFLVNSLQVQIPHDALPAAIECCNDEMIRCVTQLFKERGMSVREPIGGKTPLQWLDERVLRIEDPTQLAIYTSLKNIFYSSSEIDGFLWKTSLPEYDWGIHS